MSDAIDTSPPLSRSRIDEIISPHVVRSFSVNEPEWAEIEARFKRQWKKVAFWSRLRRAVRGSIKEVRHVQHDYSSAWSNGPANSSTFLTWSDRAFEASTIGEKSIHVALLSTVLKRLNAKRVLEVGSGNGAVALALAHLNPDVSFHGVELTEAGVTAANNLQTCGSFLQHYGSMLPKGFDVFPPKNAVQFQVGNAANLPFPNKSFDVVYTSLALEQMQAVIQSALKEIARVSRGHAVMVEPFRDFNRTEIRRSYVKAKEYLPVELRELGNFGLRIEFKFDDFPAKITRGVGLVVARPVA